jgi:alkanesulfonate monooxygenase SsuD/methylene tetrahydromethanopterin reductase-like flavin-dependent oxidoreductase (luciferase family)
VNFDGQFYQVSGLDPADVAVPPIWTGSVGPRSLAVTGRLADGWIPHGGSDWLSSRYRQSRPRIDDAAAAAGRDPAEIATMFNFGGRITAEPLAATRGNDGRWIGGSVPQWIEELTGAVLDHHAAGFIYRTTDDMPAAEALARLGHRDRPSRARSDRHLNSERPLGANNIQQEEDIGCGLLKPLIGLSERALQACLRLPMSIRVGS